MLIKRTFSRLISGRAVTSSTRPRRLMETLLLACVCTGLQAAEPPQFDLLIDLENGLVDADVIKQRIADALATHGLDRSNDFVPANRKHVAATILGKIEAGVHGPIESKDGSLSIARRTVVDSLEWFTGVTIKSEDIRTAISEFFDGRANRRRSQERSVCEHAFDSEFSDEEFVEAFISFQRRLEDFVGDYEILKSIVPGDVVAALHQREGELARAVVQADKSEQLYGFYREIPDVMRVDWHHRCNLDSHSEL